VKDTITWLQPISRASHRWKGGDCPAQDHDFDKEITCKECEVLPMIEMYCNARLVSALLNMCLLQLHGQKGRLLWHKEDDSMWLFRQPVVQCRSVCKTCALFECHWVDYFTRCKAVGHAKVRECGPRTLGWSL